LLLMRGDCSLICFLCIVGALRASAPVALGNSEKRGETSVLAQQHFVAWCAEVERRPRVKDSTATTGVWWSHGKMMSVPCSWWIFNPLLNRTAEDFAPSPRSGFQCFFPSYCDMASHFQTLNLLAINPVAPCPVPGSRERDDSLFPIKDLAKRVQKHPEVPGITGQSTSCHGRGGHRG